VATTAPPVLINTRNELMMVISGIVEWIESLPEEYRNQQRSLVCNEAFDIYSETKLRGFATSRADVATLTFRVRSFTVRDAIQHVFMQRLGLSSDHYELFIERPGPIWDHVEAVLLRLIEDEIGDIYINDQIERRLRADNENVKYGDQLY
jgi:hypothetical protein